MNRFLIILTTVVLMFGALNTMFAETVTLDYTYDGSGTKSLTLVNSSDKFYINSWGASSITVNGADKTNCYVFYEACGTYQIEYSATEGWAHIELKDAGDGCTGGSNPTASPAVTASPTPTPAVTASPTPTPAVTASPTPTPIAGGDNVVSQYGNLQVQFSPTYNSMTLCAENGSPVQLKGIGTMGLQWYPWTKGQTVHQLATEYAVKIVRAACYVEEGGYKSQQATMTQRVKDIVDDAIAEDIYVIIDWHILSDGNPKANYSYAVTFFTEMSSTYGGYPNAIFEICNEPNGAGSWTEIKDYAIGWSGNTGILDIIRNNDPDNEDNIIIVGTPNWSQWVDQPELNPIVGYNNIMYAFHFYASSQYHDFYNSIEWAGFPSLGLPEGADGISRIADEVLNRGNIALFITEWGTCEETGNGVIDIADNNLYMGWMQSRNLSWVNWSLCTKGESASALNGDTASGDAIGTFSSSNLTTSGNYVFPNIANPFNGPTASPVVTASPTPTPAVTASPTPTPAVTASPTPTPAVTASPAPTPTPGGGCDIIKTGGQTGNFGTDGPYCFKTQDTVNGWGCSNFDGRTISVTVNGTGTAVTTCGNSLPSKGSSDYYHFDCSGGGVSWAAIYWW